jgi:hypothetical protein
LITQTVYSLLSGTAGITAITRSIFPSVVPQKATFPAITYQRDGAIHMQTFDGHNSLVESSFQIDCWAKTVSGAEALAAAVKTALIDYAVPPVNHTRIDNEIQLFEAETELHRVLLQFTIWHVES